jgi:hypothetical protein
MNFKKRSEFEHGVKTQNVFKPLGQITSDKKNSDKLKSKLSTLYFTF